jgi:hypothetical protein
MRQRSAHLVVSLRAADDDAFDQVPRDHAVNQELGEALLLAVGMLRIVAPHSGSQHRPVELAVQVGEVQPGSVFVYRTHRLVPRFILNFPTKRHWRANARLDDLEAGLVDLVKVIRELEITSVAVPPLGCGNGRLDWATQVLPRLGEAFAALPNVRIILYPPAGARAPEQMPVATAPPPMTPGWAALLTLIDRYLPSGDTATIMEIEKLAYLLQSAGQPLGLNFKPARYGPYDYRLHHQLQQAEGHFLRGYGDRTSPGELHPIPNALAAAQQTLQDHSDAAARVERVAALIEGFEGPWAIELLATLHWLGAHDPNVRRDPNTATEQTAAWNDRKRDLLQPHHARVTWQQLHDHNWLAVRNRAERHELHSDA